MTLWLWNFIFGFVESTSQWKETVNYQASLMKTTVNLHWFLFVMESHHRQSPGAQQRNSTRPVTLHSFVKMLLSKTTSIFHINIHWEQIGVQCFSQGKNRMIDQPTYSTNWSTADWLTRTLLIFSPYIVWREGRTEILQKDLLRAPIITAFNLSHHKCTRVNTITEGSNTITLFLQESLSSQQIDEAVMLL